MARKPPDRIECARFYFTNITSQDKSFYIFFSPPSDIVNAFVVQIKQNSNNPSCERRREIGGNLQVYKLILNATSCQTHATLRLTPKPVKKKLKKHMRTPSKHRAYVYTESYCISTDKYNQVKGQF